LGTFFFPKPLKRLAKLKGPSASAQLKGRQQQYIVQLDMGWWLFGRNWSPSTSSFKSCDGGYVLLLLLLDIASLLFFLFW